MASPSRSYPPVKYQNPDQPSETWTGRGKEPRWLVAQLKLGSVSTTPELSRRARYESVTARRNPADSEPDQLCRTQGDPVLSEVGGLKCVSLPLCCTGHVFFMKRIYN
ncbi:H-NS histone family protein [Bradyrhizobium paxllaeri]|uniref:H-NS histone family protein n=1 Tax=Bradyrhizobium paxllaeri TaxID=190148 RepID=UPI003D31A259